MNSPHLRCDSTVGVKSVPRPQVPPTVGARDFADEDEGEVPFGDGDEDEGEVKAFKIVSSKPYFFDNI